MERLYEAKEFIEIRCVVFNNVQYANIEIYNQ